MNSATKVLVVDDEPIGRQLLEAILMPEGYDIYFGADGEEAVKVALEKLPDIILLDVMMPKMDGFEVCKKLRLNSSTVHIPIFLITALDDRDSRIKGIDLGADDYISKPFDRVEILAKIKNKTSQVSRNRALKQNTIPEDTNQVSEGLIDFLVQLTNEEPVLDYIDLYRSRKIMESQHLFYDFQTWNGQYSGLISNKLESSEAAIANAIFKQEIIRLAKLKGNQPHKILAQAIDHITKAGYKTLNSAQFSVIIIYQPYEVNELYLTGHNYNLFVCQQPVVTSDSSTNQFRLFSLQSHHDLKFSLQVSLILLSNNILDQRTPNDLTTSIHACQTNTPEIKFSEKLKDYFSKIDDILIAQLTF